MKDLTAEEALDTVEAYYNATVLTFIDSKTPRKRISAYTKQPDVLTLATWAPMVVDLSTVFSSADVNSMDTEILRELAGESEKKIADRTELERKLSALERGLRECKRYYVPPRAAGGGTRRSGR